MKESGCDAVSKKQTGDAKDGAQGKGEAHSHSQVGMFSLPSLAEELLATKREIAVWMPELAKAIPTAKRGIASW